MDFHNDDDLIGLGKAFSSLAEATVKAFDTVPGLVLTPASGDPFGSVEFDDNVLGTMDKEGSTLQDASFNFSMTDSAEITLEGTFNGDTIDSFGTVSLDLTVEQGAANYHNGQWMYGNLASLSGSILPAAPFPVSVIFILFLAGRRTHCIRGGPIDLSSGKVTGTITASGTVTEKISESSTDRTESTKTIPLGSIPAEV